MLEATYLLFYVLYLKLYKLCQIIKDIIKKKSAFDKICPSK